MAAPHRPTPDHLSFLQRAAEKAERYGFFALVRGAEARAPHLPRVGTARTPAQNVADFSHSPTMGFPGQTVERIETGAAGRPRIRSLFLGLTGPMGPLPLHLTEYAHYERRTGRSQPFGRFLDLLTDRLLQLFYRAWADTQPHVQADRSMDDRWAVYLGALSGAVAGVAEDDPFPAMARLPYVGVYVSRRSATAIQEALSQVLRAPVRIEEFVLSRRMIDPADRTRLSAAGGFSRLGVDAIAGGWTMTAEDTFRVLLRAPDMEVYESLLPGGTRHELAQSALDAFAPSHLEWELQLELDERKARPATLNGRTSLGRTGWLAPQGRDIVRKDARLRRRRGSSVRS